MAYCKGCNRMIVWGETLDGKKIPLDPKAPVYRVVERDNEKALIERSTTAMASHFATCPRANDFSASRRKEEEMFP